MAEHATERYRGRQSYEWKMNIALWTPLAAATAFLLSRQVSLHWGVAVVATAIVATVVCLFILLWRIPLEKRCNEDRQKSIYWKNKYLNAIGVKKGDIDIANVYPKWAKQASGQLLGFDEMKEWPEHKIWIWSVWFQTSITVLLAFCFVFAAWLAVGHTPSKKSSHAGNAANVRVTTARGEQEQNAGVNSEGSDSATIATIMVSSAVVIVTLFGVLAAMKRGRAANFVSAYEAIMDKLQKPEYRQGRRLLRHFKRLSSNAAVPCNQWEKKQPEWLEGRWSLIALKKLARDTYDQFDISAILVWHSNIPNLLEVFVAEYHDSIIACWEQGICFFEDRVLEMKRDQIVSGKDLLRKELYDCFSIIYVMAKYRAYAVRPELYPYYPWRSKWKFWQGRAWVAKKALEERNRIEDAVLSGKPISGNMIRANKKVEN